MDEIKFLPAGDRALVMEFGQEIDPAINARIRASLRALDRAKPDYLLETIPTYRSLLIIYDPIKIGYQELTEELRDLISTGDEEEQTIKIVEIPVIYGGDYGPDLDYVAQHNGLDKEEVIKIHSSQDYLVYMLGFTPGFSYLGGMDERIATPRLAEPRTKIPAGSTGIAGSQTGIYPIDSPGGWQLIGRTPVKLYDPLSDPPVLLSAGDFVRFIPIDIEDYKRIEKEVEEGSYQVKVLEEGGLDG
ncbi:MAG: 5-oxoprolinase subunit PxpB [Tissierellia bacterium]|nr:5-oxoprolinase subunit PxpB [Tissierellia bacterium]